MYTKTKARKYIDPDAFRLARRRAGLTMKQASIELNVNERTIRNYEKGAVLIPYPSFRIMRLLAGYSLLGKSWEGWGFDKNKLWTPEGRSFEAHELRYVGTYISLARHFLSSRTAARSSPPRYLVVGATLACTENKSIEFEALAGGTPSSATALFGAEVRQVKDVEMEMPSAFMKKPLDVAKLEVYEPTV